jgi:hypothetical protein
MKKLLLVGPVLIMVVTLTVFHKIGIVSDEDVEKIFRRLANV